MHVDIMLQSHLHYGQIEEVLIKNNKCISQKKENQQYITCDTVKIFIETSPKQEQLLG